VSATKSWLQQVDALAGDNRAGASEIAQGCARALIAYADQAKPGTPHEVEKAVFDLARKMLRPHASMAPVVRLINDVLLGLNDVDTVRLGLDTIRRVSNEYSALSQQAGALAVESSLAIFPHEATVVTVSFSSAVAKSLVLAHNQGYTLKVICLESRPSLEGRLLAASLGEVGLEVVLVVDANCMSEVRRADLVMCGADSMGVYGIVNKIGTGNLAATAHAFGIPGYVIGDTSKIWPETLGGPKIPEREPNEVWGDAPSSIRVRNIYYEVTPSEFFAGVVTERGLTDYTSIVDIARTIPVDRRLMSLL